MFPSDLSPKMLIVKNSYVVKPADPTPNEIMYVSEMDQIKPLTHAPLICFYRPSKDFVQLEAAVQVLKDSLSKVLVFFYPFAGRLQWIGGGRVEIHCNSMGALLLEAETNLKIDDLEDFRPGQEEITALLPSVDHEATPLHEIPLLLIQITKFACGGLSLGLKLSHILVDGRSTFKFLTDWANIARGEKSIDLPFFDRKIFRPKEPYPNPLPEKYSQLTHPPLLIGQTDCTEQRNKPTTVLMLKLSVEQIGKLRDKADRTLETDKQRYSDGEKFTRFEAVTAHVWRCASKARMHKSEQETRCYVTVDTRKVFTPKLPKTYFGNGAFLIPIITTAGELLSRPLGHAAMKVREGIKSVTNEYVNSFLISCENLPDVSFIRHYHIVGYSQGVFYGNPNICVTSWIGLQEYALDFGWGREFYIGPGSMGYDGRILIIPSHDKDGSLFIPIRLQVDHADAFRKYFYDEIDHQSLRANL